MLNLQRRERTWLGRGLQFITRSELPNRRI